MTGLHTDPSAELDSEIGELEEFEAVVEELSAPSGSGRGAHESVLSEAKQRAAFSDGVTDSGIEDADDGECSIITFLLTV